MVAAPILEHRKAPSGKYGPLSAKYSIDTEQCCRGLGTGHARVQTIDRCEDIRRDSMPQGWEPEAVDHTVTQAHSMREQRRPDA